MHTCMKYVNLCVLSCEVHNVIDNRVKKNGRKDGKDAAAIRWVLFPAWFLLFMPHNPH